MKGLEMACVKKKFPNKVSKDQDRKMTLVTFGKSNLKFRVLSLIDGAKKNDAFSMYEVIDE